MENNDAVKVLTDTILKAIDTRIKNSETNLKRYIDQEIDKKVKAATSGNKQN